MSTYGQKHATTMVVCLARVISSHWWGSSINNPITLQYPSCASLPSVYALDMESCLTWQFHCFLTVSVELPSEQRKRNVESSHAPGVTGVSELLPVRECQYLTRTLTFKTFVRTTRPHFYALRRPKSQYNHKKLSFYPNVPRLRSSSDRNGLGPQNVQHLP